MRQHSQQRRLLSARCTHWRREKGAIVHASVIPISILFELQMKFMFGAPFHRQADALLLLLLSSLQFNFSYILILFDWLQANKKVVVPSRFGAFWFLFAARSQQGIRNPICPRWTRDFRCTTFLLPVALMCVVVAIAWCI